MKKNTSVVFCLTVTLFGVCGLGVAKTLLENEVKEHLSDFLFLNNSQKFCEGGSIIQALNTEKLLTLNSVLDICASKKECDFVSYSPKRTLRNSLFYEDENELNNTGANWFCSGEKWVISRPRKYWITAIKEDHIKEQVKNFNLSLNMMGECDDEHVLMRIRKDVTPKEAATECNKITDCKFIVFNYNRKLGSDETQVDRVVLCSVPPKGRKNKMGFLIAGKNHEEVPHSAKKKERKRKATLPKLEATGGSITPDSHHYNFKKGEIVHARRMSS
ncbi:Uncharacterized protein PCOAH_00041120 [Plasmodium coatneyi]|uniref:Uncharacterized protein n=1 Tax=Plasmodium coatneyi TaxID=208452 RepID=A0A1B1E532_9APIC|nr:Uncharacterized protein PCOAH_00041120 [Plasmodium coatneyi]ANQ10132.1 Uncharacterized protein PCOAH_00041120 [Plasmodium coatneyi]